MESKCKFEKLENTLNKILKQIYNNHKNGKARMECLQSHINNPSLIKFSSLVRLYFNEKTSLYVKLYIPYIIFKEATDEKEKSEKYIQYMKELIIKDQSNLRNIAQRILLLNIPLHEHLWKPLMNCEKPDNIDKIVKLIDDRKQSDQEHAYAYNLLQSSIISYEEESSMLIYDVDDDEPSNIDDILLTPYDKVGAAFQSSGALQNPWDVRRLIDVDDDEPSVIDDDNKYEPSVAINEDNDDNNEEYRTGKKLLRIYKNEKLTPHYQKQPYNPKPSLIIPSFITLIQGALLGGSLYLLMNKRMNVKVIPPNPF
jgi:hypothetical protein